MADHTWRASPPNSGRGFSTSAMNGQHHATKGGGPGPKFYSVLPAATSGRASPPMQLPSRNGQGSHASGMPANGMGPPFPPSSSGARTVMGPPTSGRGLNPSSRQQSPFAGNPRAPGVAAPGPPPPMGSVSGSQSYGSGGYGAAPPRSDPGRRYGPPGGSGPPTGLRSYPQPPQSNGAFGKPPAGPPVGPPPSARPSGGWTGNGHSNGTPGQGGLNGRSGHADAFPSPSSTFNQRPPLVGPPSSVGRKGGSYGLGANGIGGGVQAYGAPASTGGGVMGGSGAMSMYGVSRPPPSYPGATSGHFQPHTNQPYSNGGIPASASAKPKIDPEQIPRPIVSEEVTTYRTCTPPSVETPPAPTSNYVAIDEGNCSPRFMRSTMAHLPTTPDALQACKLPMAVMVQPMARVGRDEEPVPVVDFGESGPLRCEKCRAYINSYATYGRNGEQWVCNFCRHEGAVPQAYQCPLGAGGLRRDRMQRPELCRGSVDFVVPKGVYCLRPEQQPIFVFCVDVSPRALETGFAVACFQAVSAALDVVPGADRARVGFMTFNSSLQVYRFDDEGTVSQIVVAADTEDPYSPLPPLDWILPIDSCRRGLPSVMETIPGLLNGDGKINRSSNKSCAAGAVLRAVADCLETIGGRVFLMTQSPPDAGAGVVNTSREDMSTYGGPKEPRMYQPASAMGEGGKAETAADLATAEFYENLAKDCAARQVCVDLMLWSGHDRKREFYDTATMGAVARMTGGRVTYMRNGSAGGRETALHLREQVRGSLRDHADSASETVLKLRCTAGIACTQRLGPGVENMPGELELALVTPHHSILCRLEHDGRKLEEGRLIYVQAALLYTSTSGQRRVRCHTLALPATGILPAIFRGTDVEMVSAVMARQVVSRALNNMMALQTLQIQMEDQMLAMLYSYRKRCAPESPSGQLILPETLRVLPLFTLCAQKMLALRPNNQGVAPDVRADERAARLLAAHSLSVMDMIKVLYPSLYSIHDLPPDVGDTPPPSLLEASSFDGNGHMAQPPQARGEGGVGEGVVRPGVDVPVALPPTSEKLSSQGVFLLDTGEDLLMYVGRGVSAEVMQELFGVKEIPTGTSPSSGYGLRLMEEEGYEQARRARNVIAHLRRGCFAHKPLTIVVANSGVAEEGRFVSLMVEDKTKQGPSYVEQLCQLHRKIQTKMK